MSVTCMLHLHVGLQYDTNPTQSVLTVMSSRSKDLTASSYYVLVRSIAKVGVVHIFTHNELGVRSMHSTASRHRT